MADSLQLWSMPSTSRPAERGAAPAHVMVDRLDLVGEVGAHVQEREMRRWSGLGARTHQGEARSREEQSRGATRRGLAVACLVTSNLVHVIVVRFCLKLTVASSLVAVEALKSVALARTCSSFQMFRFRCQTYPKRYRATQLSATAKMYRYLAWASGRTVAACDHLVKSMKMLAVRTVKVALGMVHAR